MRTRPTGTTAAISDAKGQRRLSRERAGKITIPDVRHDAGQLRLMQGSVSG
jgi:hypothetical protein